MSGINSRKYLCTNNYYTLCTYVYVHLYAMHKPTANVYIVLYVCSYIHTYVHKYVAE